MNYSDEFLNASKLLPKILTRAMGITRHNGSIHIHGLLRLEGGIPFQEALRDQIHLSHL